MESDVNMVNMVGNNFESLFNFPQDNNVFMYQKFDENFTIIAL